jgi:uncharacterized protein (TIRG00374 family)
MSAPLESTSSAPAPAGRKINWSLPVKIILTATILFFIFRKNDWAKFGAEFQNAHLLWIILAFVSMGTGLALGAFRWNLLLRVQEVFISYSKSAAYTIIGIFFSQFLPASTGGDVIKIFYILKDAPERKARAALSIVIDRIMGLLAILLLTLLLASFEYQRITENIQTRIFMIILAAIVVGLFSGLIVLWFVRPSQLPSFCHRIWVKLPKKDILVSLYEGFQAHHRHTRIAFGAVLTAIVAVIPVLSTGYCIARSLNLDVSYPQMTIIFSLVLCSMSLPISFGGHGLREGAFKLLFSIFLVTRQGVLVGDETALACSTIFLGISVIWSLVGGLVYLLYSHNIKKTP